MNQSTATLFQPRYHHFTKLNWWVFTVVLGSALGCSDNDAITASGSGGTSAAGGDQAMGGGAQGGSSAGVPAYGGATGGTGFGGVGVGGAPPANGGAPPANGGAPPTLGGAPPTLGGAPPALGGAPPTLGGAPPALGGAPPALGGAPPALGGADVGGETASGGTGEGGEPATGGAAGGGEVTVDCSTPMPTGGETHEGKSVYGTANGLGYGIWTNGDGGTITVFPDAHAFSASWANSENFLAHLGLDFRGSDAKPYAEYGTILAEFVEQKNGEAGNFSMIGIYGWMHNPCVEWYINEDSYNGLWARGDVTVEIDGASYTLYTTETTGTGGANACESGHTGPWIQMISTREAAHECGVVTVSDHFKAWEDQGWTLGNLTSVHINVEVGGGVGSIDFPVANVTTSN